MVKKTIPLLIIAIGVTAIVLTKVIFFPKTISPLTTSAENSRDENSVIYGQVTQTDNKSIEITNLITTFDSPTTYHFILKPETNIEVIEYKIVDESKDTYPSIIKTTTSHVNPGDKVTVEASSNVAIKITIHPYPSFVFGKVLDFSDNNLVVMGRYNDPSNMPSNFLASGDSKMTEYHFEINNQTKWHTETSRKSKTIMGNNIIVYTNQDLTKEKKPIAILVTVPISKSISINQ